MPRRTDLKRVMVIGSGPIVIGQAAEFDYSGTQACQALKEEGLEVVLVNSNPATIMTDPQMADRVYLEPLTVEFLAKIIATERPDGLLPTLGGQVGLNLAMELARAGVLERYNIKLLGTPLLAIQRAEDRAEFKALMKSLGEPIPDSTIVTTAGAALTFAETAGYPLIVRPAYTLGGTGGGFAGDDAELLEIVTKGLKLSPIGQCLIEKSVAGWKEIEYEVMRDCDGNCITVCNMENIDPCGVHTGDSVVVAPSQTLTDREYQMLRTASLRIISALGVEGGCNIQFALHPKSRDYIVIEVNPRVSRSSALASKATGYPIAKIAAKIAIGLTLDEIPNPVTKTTVAAFEPSLDYCVVKIPRFPFDKFTTASRKLGTQMKATGEVMAIDRTFAGALLKAVRSLEVGRDGLLHPGIQALPDRDLEQKLVVANDERLFAVAEGLRRGWEVGTICRLSAIDKFFVQGIAQVVVAEQELRARAMAPEVAATAPAPGAAAPVTPSAAPAAAAEWRGLTPDLLRRVKRLGMSDSYIGRLVGAVPLEVRRQRVVWGIRPVFKMVDTCAAEFAAATPYYYSTYDGEEEAEPPAGRRAIVLGSGPIRIGQGIEFDYSAVHAAWALRAEGIQSVIINNNPETVSTDFNTSDRLYFEPLTLEDVLNVIEVEGGRWDFAHGSPDILGIVAQFGGQTAINLAGPLTALGVPLLGTPMAEVDRAEDRKKFDQLLIDLGIPKPPGGTGVSADEALAIAAEIGYPVLVRPSYVLGGRAMQIVYNDAELRDYMTEAVDVSEQRPVLVDKYFQGKEVEVDAIADGRDVLIVGIMEHIERAGVHSGDSIAVYPAIGLSHKVREQVIDYTTRLALALRCQGMINIQYVVYGGEVYVLEVNPRASRTVPYLAKASGLPAARVASQVLTGRTLRSLGYSPEGNARVVTVRSDAGQDKSRIMLPAGRGWLWPEPGRIAVKAPVFSWQKLTTVDVGLSPEMKSTGEVMGTDIDFAPALYKALLAAGLRVPHRGTVLITVADKDKPETMALASDFAALGFRILATAGTARALEACKIPVQRVNKVSEGSPNIPDLIRAADIHLVINTLSQSRGVDRDGFLIRRAAVEHNIPCLTSLDTARAVVQVLSAIHEGDDTAVTALQDWEVAAVLPVQPFPGRLGVV